MNNLEAICESPFHILFAQNFFDENLSLSSEAKLRGFQKLEQGWSHGKGEPISPLCIRIALKLLQACQAVSLQTDVFPRLDGGVTLAIYYGRRDLAFHVKPDGNIGLDSETDDDIPSIETLALSHALFIIHALNQWTWSFSSTLPTMTRHFNASEANVSRLPATERAYLSSTRSVLNEPVEPFATMPVYSMGR